MALAIGPAPTYADVVLIDPATQKGKFNPIWLKWFLDLSQQTNTATGTVTHTAGALTANQLVIGAGGGDVAALGSLGTTTTVLHGNAAGAPTWAAVSLTADVTGTLPVANGGTGRTTSTTAYGLLAAGTTATGAHQTLAAGATTEILVGGGASALPVWTTATGTGAPVRAGSPTFTGTIGAASMTLSSLTAGRVVIVGTSGLLEDNAGLVYNKTTGYLTVSQSLASTLGVNVVNTNAGGGAFNAVESNAGALVFGITNAGAGSTAQIYTTSSAGIVLGFVSTDILTVKGLVTFNDTPTIFKASNHGLEIGSITAANTPFIDFHTDGTNHDYDVRLIASGGSTTNGQGVLTITAGTVSIPNTSGALGVPMTGLYATSGDATWANSANLHAGWGAGGPTNAGLTNFVSGAITAGRTAGVFVGHINDAGAGVDAQGWTLGAVAWNNNPNTHAVSGIKTTRAIYAEAWLGASAHSTGIIEGFEMSMNNKRSSASLTATPYTMAAANLDGLVEGGRIYAQNLNGATQSYTSSVALYIGGEAWAGGNYVNADWRSGIIFGNAAIASGGSAISFAESQTIDWYIASGSARSSRIFDTAGVLTFSHATAANALASFTGTTEASAVGTAAVIMAGGLGVAKKLYVGTDLNLAGNLVTATVTVTAWAGATTSLTIGGTGATSTVAVPGTLDSTSTTTGSLKTAGGIGVAAAAYIGGKVHATDATNATSSSTGSIICSGGAGINNDLQVGGLVAAGGIYYSGGSAGVATFGPAGVTSITVKGGLVVAIS